MDTDKTRSVNPLAYELYLRGRHFWYRRTEQGMRKSIECFEQALSYQPGFAAAYGGISDAHTKLACRGMTPAVESFPKAKSAARHAVQLQPELGEGIASLAHVRLHDWDWVGLESDVQRAAEVTPGYAVAHYWYAEYLMAMDRTRGAIGRVRYAWESDPLNSVINASMGMIRYLQRALEWLERAYREHNPDLIELTREPSFTRLRSDAKFRELTKRIGWH